MAARNSGPECAQRVYPVRQKGDFGQNFAYFLLIFHLFSTYAMVPHLLFFRPHVYRIFLFPPISTYFLHGTPSLLKTQAWNPFSVFPPTCLRILPIFHLCSIHFPPIFHLTFCPFSPVLSFQVINELKSLGHVHRKEKEHSLIVYQALVVLC